MICVSDHAIIRNLKVREILAKICEENQPKLRERCNQTDENVTQNVTQDKVLTLKRVNIEKNAYVRAFQQSLTRISNDEEISNLKNLSCWLSKFLYGINHRTPGIDDLFSELFEESEKMVEIFKNFMSEYQSSSTVNDLIN